MATETTTTAALCSQETDIISTTLTFWKNLTSPPAPLDFTQPGTEKIFDDLNKLNETVPIMIHDIRGCESNFSLEKNGFQYVDHDIPGLEKCKTDDEIREVLIPATEELVKKITGAYRTLVFTHRIRNLASDTSKRADNRAPAHSVHTDFTSAGALQHLSTVIKDPDTLTSLTNPNIRVLAINVWRPLKRIQKDPLAICDWRSFNPSCIIPNRMIFPGGFWNELGKVKYEAGQKWYTLKGQMPSEPVVFKQFDSRVPEGGMTVPHSAFVDPEWVDKEARESVEIKMFAFVEE
ncbi:uncharacterized protein BDR25DRAFT_271583 [Lindgomyces ingoldianus]|uniref:Uncharacterized protein n=1 Tax=Lindgomyces ingoldianus TaxID=673940 RepID=A0ACB6QEN4_9PLEO|nr:uncharacterized protein BDR25DRAFT_271583 [Lindgomyces ingoldianus]KAF2464587.1 hypothetical protein BDR25DRAFT_271583 [Lindgomyces ingoldianus]